MKIYMFNYKDVYKRFPEYNSFTASEWNDLDELPKEVLELIDIAKRNDMVYTELPKDTKAQTLLFNALGIYSCWGSFDFKDNNVHSWEFPIEITEQIIRMALLRGGCLI